MSVDRHLETALARIAEVRRTSRDRPFLLGLAALVFLVGAIFAWPDEAITGANWALLAVAAVVGVPITTFLNAMEYRGLARRLQIAVSMTRALKVAILGTAANLTPAPGAVVVRWDDMTRRGGVRNRDALLMNALGGLIWISASGLALLSATWGRSTATMAVGAVMLAGGAGLVLLIQHTTRPLMAIWDLIAIEVGTVAATSFRLLLILEAFSFEGGVRTALAVSSAYAVTGLIGIFPGGLGIREVLAGFAAGPIVGGVSTGFVVSSVDRVLGMLIHGLAAVALVGFDRQVEADGS